MKKKPKKLAVRETEMLMEALCHSIKKYTPRLSREQFMELLLNTDDELYKKWKVSRSRLVDKLNTYEDKDIMNIQDFTINEMEAETAEWYKNNPYGITGLINGEENIIAPGTRLYMLPFRIEKSEEETGGSTVKLP